MLFRRDGEELGGGGGILEDGEGKKGLMGNLGQTPRKENGDLIPDGLKLLHCQKSYFQ